MAAKKNGMQGTEALLEKILDELKALRTDTNSQFVQVRHEIHELREDVHKLDARLDLMALGYRDLRDRVTELEKP